MTSNKIIMKVIAKAWDDPKFKAKLLENPRSVLQAEGITFPDGINIKVVENTPSQLHIVLPLSPSQDKAAVALEERLAASDFGGQPPTF